MFVKFTFQEEKASFGGELYIPPLIIAVREPEIVETLPGQVSANKRIQRNLDEKEIEIEKMTAKEQLSIDVNSDNYKIAKQISDSLKKKIDDAFQAARLNSSDRVSQTMEIDSPEEELEESDSEEKIPGSEYFFDCGRANKESVQKALNILDILFYSKLNPFGGEDVELGLGRSMAVVPWPTFSEPNVVVEAFKCILEKVLVARLITEPLGSWNLRNRVVNSFRTSDQSASSMHADEAIHKQYRQGK